MYLKDNQNAAFLGTGELNADGDDLSAFLKKYDPNKYQNPSNTVDTLVFTYTEQEGRKAVSRLLLIKRGNHPSIGWWALPGGFVEYRENLDAAALRELREETGIDSLEICQLKCYGDYDRDPRTRVITTAYAALVPEGSLRPEAGDDAADSAWFDVKDQVLSQESEENCLITHHRLTLSNDKKALCLWADICVRERKGTILPQKTYQVMKSDRIAADHGAIILEGLHFVNGLLGRGGE